MLYSPDMLYSKSKFSVSSKVRGIAANATAEWQKKRECFWHSRFLARHDSVLYGANRFACVYFRNRNRLSLFRQRLGRAFKGKFQHLIYPFNRMDLQAIFHVIRYFGQILDVLFRNEH